MALNEEQHQKIQNYLDEKLSQEDRSSFENEIKVDENLAQEVKLHADMKTFLSDTPENDLRKSLQKLNKQVTEEKIKPGNSWRYLLLLIPILLLVGWWASNGAGEDTVLPTEDTSVETEKAEETIDPATEEVKELPTEDKAEDVPPPTPQEQPQRIPEKQEKTARPIAANFDPNPSLEFLIENNRRDNEVSLKVEVKQADIQLLAADSDVDFQFVAVLQSKADLSQQDFKLHLFSNKKADFEDFTPFSTRDLTLEKLTDDSYRIDFKNKLSLDPGRYYYIIEDFEEEQIYFVEKFEVTVK